MHHRIDEALDLNEPVQNPRQRVLNIHRGHAFMELMTEFDDEDIDDDVFTFHVVLPNGDTEIADDSARVVREVLTEFWADFYERCTTGTFMKVPCLRPDFNFQTWRTVARILLFGWQQEGYFPLQLAVPFLQYCLFNEINKANLLLTFLYMIPEEERETLVSALKDFHSTNEDDVLKILIKQGVNDLPKCNQLQKILQQVAHLHIIQKPYYVLDAWRSVLVTMNMTKQQFMNLFLELKPTNKKVCEILHVEQALTTSENESFNFLKRYIRELSAENLKLFLRFTTGADLMFTKRISVHFVKLNGLQRRPVVHKFAFVLQIPSTYENFADFRSEFNNVLISKEWLMDIA